VYQQGQPANKVFIIFDGDFEIIRKKINKFTKKEEAHNTVRFINNHIKDGLTMAVKEEPKIITRAEPISIKA